MDSVVGVEPTALAAAFLLFGVLEVFLFGAGFDSEADCGVVVVFVLFDDAALDALLGCASFCAFTLDVVLVELTCLATVVISTF